MTISILRTAALCTGLAAAGLCQAALVNGGFESGLTGWTNQAGANAAVVATHANYLGTPVYEPTEGGHFLVITAGTANLWQTVTQTLVMSAGETIAGKAAFSWGDYPDFFDGVKVEIRDALGAIVATPFSENGFGHTGFYKGPWTDWSFTATAGGSYTVVLGARNTVDSSGTSYGYFDIAPSAAPVPEPASLVLVGLGLLAGAAAGRRRAA
ncbi:MAG: PEP-CTERM sorting domain-containing protein [Burkholderiales bacterium]|nr:PEP-CTERM sorting domain-containing protein [Burkholderiales bacterium]